MPGRSTAEIVAEGRRIVAEADLLLATIQARKAAAERFYEFTKANADRAIDAATEARRQAEAALREATTNPASAEGLCSSARITQDNAAAMGAQDADNPETSLKDEWKECRATIDRFDKILVDLRKTGISFITAIIAGAAFLLTHPSLPPQSAQNALQNTVPPSLADVPTVKASIYIVIAALIIGLYLLDRVHQIWLRVAVDRATKIEQVLPISLTTEISKQVRSWLAVLIGVVLYLLLLFVSSLIFYVALGSPGALYPPWRFGHNNLYQTCIVATSIVGGAFIIVFTWLTRGR